MRDFTISRPIRRLWSIICHAFSDGGFRTLPGARSRPLSLTGPVDHRRRWSDAEKCRIVEESYQPGVSVSVVARRNDVNANLVFTWRRQFREQAGGTGGLVPVVVEPAGIPPPLADAAAGAAPATGRIEMVLADGSRVIVDREVDGSAASVGDYCAAVLSDRQHR